MNMWSFADRNTGAFVILCIALLAISAKSIIILIQLLLRHLNIRKHGYPPAHCDADGDLTEEF